MFVVLSGGLHVQCHVLCQNGRWHWWKTDLYTACCNGDTKLGSVCYLFQTDILSKLWKTCCKLRPFLSKVHCQFVSFTATLSNYRYQKHMPQKLFTLTYIHLYYIRNVHRYHFWHTISYEILVPDSKFSLVSVTDKVICKIINNSNLINNLFP